MYEVEVQATFITKSDEQAIYICKFFADASSLMTCENSEFKSAGPHRLPEAPKMPQQRDGKYAYVDIDIKGRLNVLWFKGMRVTSTDEITYEAMLSLRNKLNEAMFS